MGGPYTPSRGISVTVSPTLPDTDFLAEGATNLYFTEPRVRATVLTGLSLITSTAITAADSLLVALGKLQAQNTLQGSTTNITEGTNLYYTDARVRATVLTGFATGVNSAVLATDTLLAALGKIQTQITSNILANTTALPEGTNLYYTAARVRANTLTGLALSPASAITAADSVLSAFGKLQAQLTAGIAGGLKNKLINGDFKIWQRGNSGTIPVLTQAYTADKWVIGTPAGITCNWSRIIPAVGDEVLYGASYAQFSFLGAGSASTVRHRIEDVRLFSGKTVTISFFAADSVATAMTVVVRQSFGTGGSPSALVDTTSSSIPITSTLTKYVTTINVPSISGKTLGTADNHYLEVFFNSTTTGPHDQWLAKAQFEISDSPTDFDERPIGLELLLCQRYAVLYGNTGASAVMPGVAQRTGTTICANTTEFPVKMRRTPTVTTSSPAWAAAAPVGNEVAMLDNVTGAYTTITGALTLAASANSEVGIFKPTASTSFSGSAGNIGNIYLGPTAWVLFSADF